MKDRKYIGLYIGFVACLTAMLMFFMTKMTDSTDVGIMTGITILAALGAAIRYKI